MAKQKINFNQTAMTPMVFAWRPNGVTATVAGPAILVCSTAVVNIGGNYNTSTGVFTAPRAGKYYVGFTGFKNNDTSAGQLDIRINNGISTANYRTFCNIQNSYVPMAINVIVPLNANDTVDVYIQSGLTMHTNQSSQLVIMYLGE